MSSKQETIFSKIIRREIPAKIVFENERVLAFRDISPQAPTHILIVPKRAIESLATAQATDQAVLGEILFVAAELARSEGLGNGYRVVFNTGTDGGQTVAHLHAHLLGGRALAWPPG